MGLINERQPLQDLKEASELQTYFPTKIDIHPTALCNLDCPMCWGLNHSIPDILNTEQWQEVLKFFAQNGTQSVVFTGGEPLIRRDIIELFRFAKNDLGLTTTLSTNTILLPKKKDILYFTDEIGIPIDGSTHQKNKKTRVPIGNGNPPAFQAANTALELLAEFQNDTGRKIHTTIRTVANALNIDDLVDIGALLNSKRDKLQRWKIYQFAPISIGALSANELKISSQLFAERIVQLRNLFPEINIQDHPLEARIGRYVFVSPEGDIFGVGNDGEYVPTTNFLTSSSDELLEGISQIVVPEKNLQHGNNSYQS